MKDKNLEMCWNVTCLKYFRYASTCTQPKQKPSKLPKDSRLIKKKLATNKGATAAYSSEAESESSSMPSSYNSTPSTSSMSSEAKTDEYVSQLNYQYPIL